MSKKITELMDDIDFKLLEDIELEDLQMDEDIDTPSLENIKNRAMQGICKKGNEKTKKPKVIRLKRHLLPLIAAILLLGSTAIAIGSSEHIKNIFGESFELIKDDVQTVQMTDQSDGIIFTAEEVIIDNQSAIIIVSSEKEDGTAFEEGVGFLDLYPTLSAKGGSGWSKQTYLSEDKTKLFTVIDYSAEKRLHDKELTLIGKSLGKWETHKEIVDIDLYDMYKQSGEWEVEAWDTYLENYDATKVLGEVVIDGLPIVLNRVQHREGRLELMTGYIYEPWLEMVDFKFYMENRETGEIINSYEGAGSGGGIGDVHHQTQEFIDFRVEDLEHMDLGVEIQYFDAISNGEWQVSFKLDKNKNILSKSPNVNIKRGDLKMKIREVEVSALGVKIKGTKNKAILSELDMQLLLKDGTKLELVSSAASSRYNYLFTQSYVVGEKYNKDVVDTTGSGIEEAVTQGSGAGWSSYSVSTQQDSPTHAVDVDLPDLIDIEKVQGIFIQGTYIELVE